MEETMKRLLVLVIFTFMLTLFGSAPLAMAGASSTGSATAVVNNFYAQLLDTMKQGDQLGYSGRYKKLQPAIDVERIHLEGTAKKHV